MPLTDDELFDFDRSPLAGWDKDRAAETLAREPDLYRNHLTIAKWLDKTIANIEARPSSGGEREDGLVHGLAEVAAHLRQADLVPGAVLYEGIAGGPIL
jgi:hypothetical protein